MAFNERYARQTILQEIGIQGQNDIENTKVLCIGAGGLASSLLQYLVSAGIGTITILDHDIIELSNLQRQTLYSEDDIGKHKAQTAVEKLKKLNQTVNLSYVNEALTTKNVKELFTKHDIIVDTSDNFATKYLINDACVKYNKPFVYGSILGFDGQLSVFDPRKQKNPCYRCLYKQEPKTKVLNCAQAGVLGAVVGALGSLQAVEVIKLALKQTSLKPLVGKLFVLSAGNMQASTLGFAKKQDCPVCSKNKDDIILQDVKLGSCVKIAEIDKAKFLSLPKNYILLDVREQKEHSAGCIENSLLFSLSALKDGKLPKIEKDKKIVVYCQSGMRSKQACEILLENGFVNVCSLQGGFNAFLG